MGNTIDDAKFEEMMDVLNDLVGCLNKCDSILDDIKKNGGFILTTTTEHLEKTRMDKKKIMHDSWEYEESSQYISYYSNRISNTMFKHHNTHAFNVEKAIFIGKGKYELTEKVIDVVSETNPVMLIGIEDSSDSAIKSKYIHLRKNMWQIVKTQKEAEEFISKIDENEMIGAFNMSDDVFQDICDKYFGEMDRIEAMRMRKLHLEGDIIITDPCYIVKHRDESTRPKWDDFHPYKSIYEYPDYNETTKTSKQFDENTKKMDEADRIWEAANPDDWDSFDDIDLSRFGINSHIAHRTLYGDWSCTTVDEDGNVLGQFCADSGMVGVFLLDEVLAYNPDYDDYKENKWTVTLIKGFKGEVWFEKLDEETLIVKGKGNINFHTYQSGF